MQAAKESVESEKEELKCSLAEAEEELTHMQAYVDTVEAASSSLERARQVGHKLSRRPYEALAMC